jgi:Zn ribbon nucleic-acid-binding protein
MSRTVECPKCKSFATVVERTKDFKYIVECKNCGAFEISGSEERTARLHYTKRIKNGQGIQVPSPAHFKLGIKMQDNKKDLLNGIKYYPIIARGLSSRFKTVGYIRVVKRSPEGGLTIDSEGVSVDDIANMQWKEASEKYELQKGVEWHCVEGAYGKFTLVRCLKEDPKSGAVIEKFFLKPRA